MKQIRREFSLGLEITRCKSSHHIYIRWMDNSNASSCISGKPNSSCIAWKFKVKNYNACTSKTVIEEKSTANQSFQGVIQRQSKTAPQSSIHSNQVLAKAWIHVINDLSETISFKHEICDHQLIVRYISPSAFQLEEFRGQLIRHQIDDHRLQ